MRAALWLLSAGLAAAGPAEDWRAIEALDAGPRARPASAEEARLAAANHLDKQRVALERFLREYPADPRAPQARLKLGSVLAVQGKTSNDPVRVRAALALFSAVEADPSLPDSLRADAGFRGLSLTMQDADPATAAGRSAIVAAARKFVSNFPGDARGPRALVEAAVVCDGQPDLKRALLAEARAATRDPGLLNRINDDFRRLDALGKPLEIEMPTLAGDRLKLSDHRGAPVLLVFWSSESPQSLLWLRDLRATWNASLAAKARVVTVNVDSDRSAAEERAAWLDPGWPVGFEEGGWDGRLVRSLGVNALPTVWALDRDGVVRSINARADWRDWLRKLSADP